MKIGRILKFLLILVLVILVLLYIGLPLGSAIAVIAPDTAASVQPPEGFTDVSLTTDDEITLAAWYAPPENGIAVVMIHGAGSGRSSMRTYAEMLHADGYGVLALDLRGFGESGGRINCLGWNGTRDVGAAVAFLHDQSGVTQIAGLGVSLGGEVLLGAVSTYPELAAIIADGATFRSVGEYQALPNNRSLVRNFTTGARDVFVALLSGDSPPAPPFWESIAAAGSTRFLFIAAGNDPAEIEFNTQFQAIVGDRGALWIVPNVGHTGGFSAVPAAYRERVITFYAEALGG